MENESSTLCGMSTKSTNEMLPQFSPNELSCFEYAPLVSWDVERVFSQYKCILADILKYNVMFFLISAEDDFRRRQVRVNGDCGAEVK